VPRVQCGELFSRVRFVRLADDAYWRPVEPNAIGAHPQALQVANPIHIPGQRGVKFSPTYPEVERH
jgi:hypothetical protein